MEIPTTKYLADYLYVVHEDVPFRYYRKTKCSVIRGVILCLCLNLTYANVVRFPRELDLYGTAYVVPYTVLLLLVGFPIALFEIAVGQFLGKNAVHSWRASPIFKGACIVGQFASWLSSIWISLQAIMIVGYIGMFIMNTMPFRECPGNVNINKTLDIYTVNEISGQECLQRTFLSNFWDVPLYFGMMLIGLIGIWIVVMLSTHNSRVLRRCIFFFGFLALPILISLTGWNIKNAIERWSFPDLWPFDIQLLRESNIWFSALMQVLYSTNCGFGVLPILTGKFMYKGDAVRTSIIYICFMLLINVISVALFMDQFYQSANSGYIIDELKPLTAIYDRVLYDRPTNDMLVKSIPIAIYILILLSAFISMVLAIYTTTRLVPRHPNYVISAIALLVSFISLSAPKFIVPRVLDTRIVGTIAVTALIFNLIALTWIYGANNIYTDLEFSIGRPIFKGWLWLWCMCPTILTGLLVWWCSDDDQFDLLAEYMPRWAPILFALFIISIIACVQIFRQVEYNFFGMICEASKSAKEWGPADPLARHSWKQWRSVCQDTGQRDFTLRRRGTRDYTHSIKKGQYSNASKFNGNVSQPNWKSSTPGNSSPNYSGSMFGDSAIEEDISVDKFPGITTQQLAPFQGNDNKALRYSHRSRTQQRILTQNQQNCQPLDRQYSGVEQHREIVYIRRLSDSGQHATRIEITPSNDSITYCSRHNGTSSTSINSGDMNAGNMRNVPAIRQSTEATTLNSNVNSNSAVSVSSNAVNLYSHVKKGPIDGRKKGPLDASHCNVGNEKLGSSTDHICWRKFAINAEEYSTEL